MTRIRILLFFYLFFISGIAFSCTGEKTGLEKNAEDEVMPPNIIVIFTDDHGYADLGVQNQVDDIHTPHIDNLALNGARFTNGYVTAPVCAPSRIGLISGQYQQRFGVESNANANNFPANIATFPQRMQELNYVTGMVGKAHFGRPIATIGFDDYFMHKTGPWEPVYSSTHDLEGNPFPSPQKIDLRETNKYRIDEETKGAVNFIKRHADQPFFLYVAYTAPHVPLAASQKYLERFPNVTDKKRKLCLAMLSAVDDGVGAITKALKEKKLEHKTLIFFISDNGGMTDPGNIGYDASLNKPLLGEKGLLLEGGIRVPWIMYWEGMIPGGQVIHSPVISLDVAATVLPLSGMKNATNLDGINLLPYIRERDNPIPKRALFWYTRGQQAVRYGKWKLFRTTHKKFSYLVNLDDDISECKNLAGKYPVIANQLGKVLDEWQRSVKIAPDTIMHPVIENRLFHFVDTQKQEGN